MRTPLSGNPIRVLLVEDNPADVDLTREALEHGKLNLALEVVTDGHAAINLLRSSFATGGQERLPDLILLDLNLPKKNGRDVLAEIKSHAETKRIPVVVLTSSDAEVDVLKSYALGANCFVRKPLDFGAFQKVVRELESFWFTIVRLPGRNQGDL